MSKVERQVAESEVQKWLDFKRIGDKKREAQKPQIEVLVDAVEDGDLVLDEQMVFVHTLKFPLMNEQPVKELSYKPRLSVLDIHSKLEGVKSSDADGRVLAYVAALAGKPRQIIKSLDSEDYAISQALAIFFL